jgi:hypothetical protein
MAVGSAIDCTDVPAELNSSRKTGVAALVKAALPSPTRNTTRFPVVKEAALAKGTEFTKGANNNPSIATNTTRLATPL